jgi:type II secretory pathway pseudopilin PulG
MTLVETMVVIALLGVIAALAVPNLSEVMNRVRIDGATEQLAGFLHVARAEAMTSKRCTRITLPAGGTSIRLERLNSFDCDQSPETARRIDGAPVAPATTWVVVKQEQLEGNAAVAGFEVVPTELRGAPPGNVGAGAEVRFRPNGRVWGRDTNVTNDDAVLFVRHKNKPAIIKRILVEGNGLLCVLGLAQPAPGGPVDFRYPT